MTSRKPSSRFSFSSAKALPHVFQHRHGGVAAVHGDDATAGVGTGAAEVKSGHRSPGSEAVAPHVARQAVALKNMASGEAHFLLDIRRSHHLCFQHRIRQVGTETADGIESQLAYPLAMIIPG